MKVRKPTLHPELWRALIVVALVGLAVVIVIGIHWRNQSSQALRDSNQARRAAAAEIIRADIGRCLTGAHNTVESLNFDSYIYDADFRAGKDPANSPSERKNRTSEAQGLFAQDVLRAHRVDVSALHFTGPDWIRDPNIRTAIAIAGYRCVNQYPRVR